MYSWDFATGVGLTIANDTQSVALDTAAFDANFAKLVAMGYRDLKLPIPGCQAGSSCAFESAAGARPDMTWFFGNSTGFTDGHGWYGNCEGSSGCVIGDNAATASTIEVPIFVNASLNAPSRRNSSLQAWQTQLVGDPVELNPKFVRLFHLVMAPMVDHLRARGWIDRVFAFVTDEPRWPCYSGTNFTVNAYVQWAKLFRSLDPELRIQQDLTPTSSNEGPVWDAVAPVVDAWVWQAGEFGFGVASGHRAAKIVSQLDTIARVRKAGKQAFIYNNEIAIIDVHPHNVRTFPWQLWRTNYAYPNARHAGFEGSLSWYSTTSYFGSNPYQNGNVICSNPGGQSAHPTKPPRPGSKPCLTERAAGLWFTMYPPSDGDICHKGPTTSIRWELLRQGLEDVEYLAMLDRLAGAADRKYRCGYEAAVLRGAGAPLAASPAANASAIAAVCCDRLTEAKAALDSVDLVTWGITGNANTSPGDPVYNVTEQQPYTTDPAVLHRVLDAVASAIEAVQQSCP